MVDQTCTSGQAVTSGRTAMAMITRLIRHVAARAGPGHGVVRGGTDGSGRLHGDA